MADEIVELYWDVSNDGYEWIESREAHSEDAKKELFLTEGVASGKTFQQKRYRPLQDHSGLFRIFADVEPTEAGILGFANKYGLLGGDVSGHIRISTPGKPDSIEVGEPIKKWKDQIGLMGWVWDLWQAAQTRKVEEVSRLLNLREEGKDSSIPAEILFVPGGFKLSGQIIKSPEDHPGTPSTLDPKDIVKSALLLVQHLVNEQLARKVFPYLLWSIDATGLGLGMQPTSLLGALWLQLARAIDGQKEYRQCKECQTWFELSPEVARTNRLYCSNACRIRAYRGRQEKAQEMNRKRKPINEIAKILGTNVRTARVWISRAKRKSLMEKSK